MPCIAATGSAICVQNVSSCVGCVTQWRLSVIASEAKQFQSQWIRLPRPFGPPKKHTDVSTKKPTLHSVIPTEVMHSIT